MGPVLIDNTICNGNETRLFDCIISSVGAANCSRSGVAGVRCSLECMWIAMSCYIVLGTILSPISCL